MKKCALIAFLALVCSLRLSAQHPVALDQLLSAPFPENLTAAKKMNRIAWTFDQEGKRNVWVAEGPSFNARKLTSYAEDDGQEISDLRFTDDGSTLVYSRGGSKNPAGEFPNPTSNPAGVEQSVWSIGWNSREPKKLDAGHSPKISAPGMAAYIRDNQIWIVPLDASEKPTRLVVRGQSSAPEWSPAGTQLAFVSARGDHAFIPVYDLASKTVNFIAPSADSDSNPVWSIDGKRIAFVRRAAQPRDSPQGFFIAPDQPHPWAVWVADATTRSAHEIWHSSESPQGSFPY